MAVSIAMANPVLIRLARTSREFMRASLSGLIFILEKDYTRNSSHGHGVNT